MNSDVEIDYDDIKQDSWTNVLTYLAADKIESDYEAALDLSIGLEMRNYQHGNIYSHLFAEETYDLTHIVSLVISFIRQPLVI